MAKQYDNLYPDLCSFSNLYWAYRKAAKGKRGQFPVAAFEYDLEANLFQLQAELERQTYQPGAYYSFYIRDPKHRLISAAPFKDRVAHHALCNIIEPIFERTFIGDSYANRVGKGTHKALDRAQGWVKNYPYVLQCDIRQFFPSIDHAILRKILARKIADPQVVWLCDQIITSGAGVLNDEYDMHYFPGDDPSTGSGQGLFAALRPRGLPIGNLTSQFWGNVFLNELDQFVKRQLRVSAYCRYVDDFLLFSDSKSQLWAWKDAIREFLTGLRLTMHAGRSTVYPVSTGIPFLGFRIYPTHRRLKRYSGVAFSRRLCRAYRQIERGDITKDDLDARVQGWVAHAAHGDTWGLRRSLLNSPLPSGEGPGVRGRGVL
ncbi:MAG: RNA-directed DNA polymerase [Anaerolineae bacterium]|nr:RNA-directed DNA polymerase [Anaerolineae bacterium]